MAQQNKHKYRVSIYLGKDNYEELQSIAEKMMIPIATLCKIIFATGLELSKQIEKGALSNGDK